MMQKLKEDFLCLIFRLFFQTFFCYPIPEK